MAEYVPNDEQIVNEHLRLSLRKMVRSFGDYIKDVDDYEQLEDNLKHMEETDENFHKYDLVEMLTDKIESVLGIPIDKHVNETFSTKKFDGDIDAQNKMAQTICANIMKTKEFGEFKTTFKTNISKANDSLLKNFQANFVDTNCEETLTLMDNDKQSVTFTNDFECLSLDNSISNQNSFVFFNSEQFPVIAQNLDQKKPDSVRLKAIQQMLSIPAGDPQAADHWIAIRKFLLLCLKDPNKKIASLCLKLHSRTLASSHYKVSMEIYITLIEHLAEFFKDRELEKRALGKTTIEILATDNSYLLKIFRLVNDYAKDITSKWTRYPENFIETIITETLKLFSIVSDQKISTYMTPIHYIALLDTQSIWFVKWMHGHDCRRILIRSLKKNDSFLVTSVNSIYSYLQANSRTKHTENSQPINNRKKSSITTNTTTSDCSASSTTKRTVFRKSEIEYLHFVHSINVVRKILCFQNGRRLFPIKLANKEIRLKDLIKAIIQIVFETSHFKTLNEHSPSKYAFDLLQDLSVAEETCRVCLCNEEVIEQLIKPLKSIMQMNKKPSSGSHLSSTSNSSISSVSNLYDESCMSIVANVLAKLASTECGYSQLLYSDSKTKFQVGFNRNSPANTIVTFVCKALNNQLNYYLSTSEIAEYLYLARLLYSQCQGVFLIKEHDLNKAISESAKLTIKETTSSYAGIHSEPNTPRLTNSNLNITFKETFSFSWSDSLLDNLSTMASTPKGVFYLAETGLLGKVVNYMFKRYKARLQVGRYEKFGYGFMISQLANIPSGCYHLSESGLIQYLIEEIWTELEHGSDDFMSAFPRSYSVDIIDREVYKPMLCFFNILSSFAAVFELLGDINATPRSFYSVREKPKGLIGLLDRVVFIDQRSKISSLFNYEQSHIFGIRLLSFLQSDLDVLLLLESQYDYSNILLYLQRLNRPQVAHYDFNNEAGDVNQETDMTDDIADSFDQTENKRSIIIDMLSIERNFVLVNSNLIGGPCEKLLPPRNTDTNQNENFKSTDQKTVFDFPLFDSLPVPSYYTRKTAASNVKNDKEFFELIEKYNFEEISKNDNSLKTYLHSFRKCFTNSIKNARINYDVLPLSMSQFIQVLMKLEASKSIGSTEFKNFNEFLTKANNLVSGIELSNLQKLGVQKAVQYGFQVSQLQKFTQEENAHNLIEVHKFTKLLLLSANKPDKNPKRPQKNTSDLNYSQEESFPSYDWFVATIFLIYRGDKVSTMKFLYNFHFLEMSSLIWPARLYSNDTLISNVYSIQGISILISTTCHYIELILKIELPFIFNAFRMSGLAPSQICSHWLKQFFWNYLDWPDIVMFINQCLVFGVDYQTYYCLAILKHLNENQKIVQHHTYKDLQIYLKETQIEGFKIEKYIGFMNELEAKYRGLILDDVQRSFEARN